MDEILTKTGAKEEDIDKMCSDEHIREIARNIEKWELIAEPLGLRDTHIEVIHKEHRDDVEVQRVKCLKKWKKMFEFKATYRCLIEACLKCERAELAVSVCTLLSSSQDMD